MAVGEWDQRQLCPDGTCTGLIGPEGTCKLCGHAAPNWGDERKRGLADADDDDDDDAGGDDLDEDDDLPGISERDPIVPGVPVARGPAWTERSLCPDGACIGLIGSDGTCKVCGKVGVPGPATEGYDDDDDEYEDDDDEDDDDDELAAAADALADVATPGEVEGAGQLADHADHAAPAAADDVDDRKLCPDGACVGVIGPAGKCKLCGKDAA